MELRVNEKISIRFSSSWFIISRNSLHLLTLIQLKRMRQVLANGASHPGFTEIEDGLFQSTGFDAYGKKETNGGSANSAYGMETAHHGHDQELREKQMTLILLMGIQTVSLVRLLQG